ncbi:ribosomal protein S18 acetylase RimI-like enzyme [Paenibacillus endophyticus]|uniref:Ribosomal protein S18 acetylase RimI-like enzyme n=1 Tax=Paenibacillus endophyticus TaxID=1294268 RepID=A0A7W5C772_9BACL|nr:GNAT family N-acetyltransferase [Paenibacillus endophyticus]MBB3151934.1 ribosomal protein S18 acetylase RimI-like enzyme [Paenibacillus endophyticus]
MINYYSDRMITAADLSLVFENSGIKRPFQDLARLEKMIEHADLIITAWDGSKLVGIARCLTDFVYCCYLSDLAVSRAYQRLGIGKQLVEHARAALGPSVSVVLLSAPTATEYYPRIGFTNTDKCFLIPRES